MTTRPSESDAKALESYRIAIDNSENQAEIASSLTEIGYGPTIIQVGKTLYNLAREAFDKNSIEDDETSEASENFKNKKAELKEVYKIHRKKASILFRTDNVVKEKLAIKGSQPDVYINWIEAVKKFYSVATTDTNIQTKLASLAISTEELTNGQTLVNEVETARAEYLREVGESQEATKAKDAALKEIDIWMRDFKAVARIALEDKPQLLEALGIFVRS